MIDWNKVAEGWAGFGVTILVLIILSLVAWIVGLVIQKTRAKGKEEEVPAKEAPAKEAPAKEAPAKEG